MGMSPDRWARVERLYHEALVRPLDRRAAFLAEACAGDEDLQREVESLLDQPDSFVGFLDRPAVAAAAHMDNAPGTATMTGRRIGAYQVLAPLGAGGMGEVYRAHDTRLGRDVAIKILPSAFTSNPDRLARFEREARMLASLNHPHIGAIYGVEEQSGDGGSHVAALILELIEGQTMAERLARGPLPVAEVLTFARQIADALDAAHEKGIVHRDLKPANIKITADGAVKVLDFGLAKLDAHGAFDAGTLSQSPTVTIDRTQEGVIVGTAGYMSPEQARGMPVDKRTDVWAFGCVLYEMLTGRLAFAGETVSDAIAAVLGREPDWNALPPATPPVLRRLLQRCLVKDPRRRLRDIGDARVELEDTLAALSASLTSASAGDASHRRAIAWYAATTAVLSALIATVAVWNLKPVPATSPQPEARLTLPLPEGIRLPLGSFGSVIAVSPDGNHVAFVGESGKTDRLYLRTLKNADTKMLPDTEGAMHPFFSPDSRWLAFVAGGKLQKVPTTGGVPVVLCDVNDSRGGFWSENGTIVFSPKARGAGIFQVSADGGAPKEITTLDTSRGETSHRLPELLPGGETILFAAYGATFQDVAIVAQSLKTGERHVLIEGASLPRYVSTGHLLYVQPKRPGTIMAVAFDPETRRLMGPPVPVVEGVLSERGDYAHWSIARSGMLVYAPGGFQEPQNNLVYVDRKGVATPVGTPPGRPYSFPRLSPDGRRLVVTLQGIQDALWMYERATNTFNRLTFAGNNDWSTWTPDGKRVAYASVRAEPWRLFWKSADGSGNEEPLLATKSGAQQPYSWSPDGKVLVYSDGTPGAGQDIWALRVDGDRQPTPILRTPASEVDARLSPDGRWLAYVSDESGRYEVYVQSFSSAGGKWQISTIGGREPVWAHNGRELFYRNEGQMMAVEVATERTFQAATPRLIFQGPYEATTTISPDYDVTPDDQRFVMVQRLQQQSATTNFNVVLNWSQELKRLVPAN